MTFWGIILDRQFDANKKEFTFTLSDEFKKEFTNNENSEIISSALDDLNFAMKARQFIEEKVNSTTQVKNHILKLRDHCKLELYKISHKVPFNGTFKHFLIK